MAYTPGGAENTLASEVELYISCTDLPSLDLLSASDPFAIVSIRDETSNRKIELGRTETLTNNNNPNFGKRFKIPYHFEQEQMVFVQIWDEDVKDHDYIGEVQVSLGEIISAPGGACKHRLKKNGSPLRKGGCCILKAEQVVTTNEMAVFHMRASKLRRMDLFGKSDPYLAFYREHTDGSWLECHRTEVIKQNLNPVWKPFEINLGKLCGGNKDRKILIKMFDWDKDSIIDKADDFMGQIEVTINQLLKNTQASIDIPLIKPKDMGKKKAKNRGTLTFAKFKIERIPSFLEFLAGGMQVSLMVAIDFTGSNKDPSVPDSLHYRGGDQPNQYESAITTIGNILAAYDSDKMFPVWGFGGFFDNNTSHC